MKIAHISDIHCNFGSDFNEIMFDKAAKIVNSITPDFVYISGDLTSEGLLTEYQLVEEKLKQIDAKLIIVPGNHDERNLGFKLFPEFFGETDFINNFKDLNLVGLSSSEPDRDNGRLGRGRHKLIEDAIKKDSNLTVIGFHHHILPVPNSGRETNIIEDAGGTLDIILKNEVPLVLMGHRHVPWGVKINKSLFINAGTFSCTRTRAHFGNTFNIIDIDEDEIEITVVNIGKDKHKKMIEFDTKKDECKNKYYC